MPPQDGGAGLEITVLGRRGQAVFVRSEGPSDAGYIERSRLESLDGRFWLIGDVRLDGAHDLRRKLMMEGEARAGTAGDARLCLLAYARWKERFTDFLAGDFALVIWDDERQDLTAVHDQLGKRDLFHGRAGTTGVVGNSLDWVAGIVSPERTPDDYWIADFLTIGCSREPNRTAYRDIARLAPAHALHWSASGSTVRRYWQLDMAEPLYLARHAEYLERFRFLASQAIEDRMPDGTIGISMSGGIDSTALAALAVRSTGDARRVKACCFDHERFSELHEARFARLAADHIGIDLQVVRFDEMTYDPGWQSRGIRSAEPLHRIINAHPVAALSASLALVSPIWLEGEGPDNALELDRNAYLGWLAKRRSWRRLAGTLAAYALVKGPRGWLESLRRHAAPERASATWARLPPWIDASLADRLKLDTRIADLGDGGDPSHPWHPEAFRSFTGPYWRRHFADTSLEEALAPIQWRHPFLDLRILQFMLSVPPIPWGWKKALLREAMRGSLPDAILKRPKESLPGIPLVAELARHGLPGVMAPGKLAGYVDLSRLPALQDAPVDILHSVNAYVLDHWLATQPARAPRLH